MIFSFVDFWVRSALARLYMPEGFFLFRSDIFFLHKDQMGVDFCPDHMCFFLLID